VPATTPQPTLSPIYAVFGDKAARLYEISSRTNKGGWDSKFSVTALVGRFALTAAVPNLELRDDDSDWRQVILDELKKILAEDGELAEAAEEPQASAERESFNRLVAEGEHIINGEIALFRAGIPFLQLPFQQNKFASNLFMVLNVPKAKAYLLRAGFQAKFDSETVLLDGCNGQAVQLLQGKYRLPSAKS
jgi:hypothetical protein